MPDQNTQNNGATVSVKKGEKQKIKKVLVILLSALAVIGIALIVINMLIPGMSEDDIEAAIVESIQPQIEKVKEELDVSDLTVEVTFENLLYEKPTVFSKGRIRSDVKFCYVSTGFTDLDTEIYTEETSDKYYKIKNPELSNVEISGYRVSLYCSKFDDPTFKDSSGDFYDFGFDKINKNGKVVFEYRYSTNNNQNSSSNSSGKKKCKSCGRYVNSLITKKDKSGTRRTWCSSCWSDYNYIMY